MNKSISISDDVQSVNFREIRVENIAPNTLYRSSHPIQDNRQEPIISILAAKYRIAAVINLSDTFYGVKRKAFFAPWYNRLFLPIIGLLPLAWILASQAIISIRN
jgi:hypothetical protein